VDAALLFAEYSPGATGIQPVEDLLPIIARRPGRYRLVDRAHRAGPGPQRGLDLPWIARPVARRPGRQERQRTSASGQQVTHWCR
jgi:hypothetical protein